MSEHGDLNQASKTAQTLRETLDTLDEVERLFTESVREAGERVRTAGEENRTDNNKKVYSLSEQVNSYSTDEITSITRDNKNRVASTYADVFDFIYSALDGNDTGRLFLGKLKNGTSARIMAETNVSVYDKSVILSMDEIRHLFKHHGNSESEALRGQEAITDENFRNVLSAIFDFDTVEKSEDKSGVISLVFQKENNGTTTAVTVVSEKKKALTLKSAWITKNGSHISPPSDVQAPNQTPNSELSMNADPTGSLPQNSDSVNRKFSISEENSSDTSDRRYSIAPPPTLSGKRESPASRVI